MAINTEFEHRYEDMVKLGFIREDLPDQLHVNDVGYDNFTLDKKLRGGCNLVWDHRSLKVALLRYAKDGGSIIGRITCLDIHQIKMYIAFFRIDRKQDQ